jgi:N-acetylglutamate synthase-like GNAT family acetyltransferase
MPHLRQATQQNFPAIRKLIWKVGINPMGLDWRRFLVAVGQQGQLIGCGQIKPHKDGSRELASIAVEEAWRRRGVARLIIERLLEGETGTLYLTCRGSLGPFYEKFGFQIVENSEKLPGYFNTVMWFSRHTPLIPKSLLIMKRRIVR